MREDENIETDGEGLTSEGSNTESARSATETTGERVGWNAWVAPLSRSERQQLFERINTDSMGGPDYYIMMVLSASLASLGLLQDSTAVVIGAMLVAPLMGPLLGAGLALVQDNLKLIRSSLGVILSGVALGLTVAGLYGVANPGFEPTMEVEARGRPDILDLFIALISGMVAAYAQCRFTLSNTLAGVAIAAALVPPLAVVGISTASGELQIATFASVLLLTNIVAIVLGAAFVFRIMGAQPATIDAQRRPWVRRSLISLGFVALMLSAPLLLQGIEKSRTGQNRPAGYPVSLPVRTAVANFLVGFPSVELVTMARSSVEPESGITIVLSTMGPLVPGFRRKLRQVIADARGTVLPENFVLNKNDTVRIYVMLEAPYATDGVASSGITGTNGDPGMSVFL